MQFKIKLVLDMGVSDSDVAKGQKITKGRLGTQDFVWHELALESFRAIQEAYIACRKVQQRVQSWC